MMTPIRLTYPNALPKTGRKDGGAKMNINPAHTNGPPKCMMPYGSHARTSRTACLCVERILLRLAP